MCDYNIIQNTINDRVALSRYHINIRILKAIKKIKCYRHNTNNARYLDSFNEWVITIKKQFYKAGSKYRRKQAQAGMRKLIFIKSKIPAYKKKISVGLFLDFLKILSHFQKNRDEKLLIFSEKVENKFFT